MTNTITPQDFVAKWHRADVKERSAYQEHFIDLCHLVGSPTPIEDDPKGERFMFEAGAIKQVGGEVIGHGWADVWKKDFFAFEYKGKHADLDKAYAQLQQYRESLQNPPLLIVCDLNIIIIHTNFTNMVKKVYTITLDDLLTPAGLDTIKAAFFNPDALKSNKTAADVTQEAAKEFATLADLLRKYGTESQKAAHFLIRMLFCLFAEDVGLLQRHLIKTMVAQSRSKPGLMTQQLKKLFGAMASGGYFGPIPILHFDGGLFDSEEALDLDSDSLDVLSKISEFDWSSVEPTIFGTLFERSLDPSKRSQLGAHYTDKGDILLVVEPVLMTPLRRRWAEVKAEAIELAKKRDAAKGRAKTKPADELKRLILGFADEIAKIQVLDPACGSGNFLYVSLRLLLDLEKEVITLAGDLDVGRFFPSVHPKQLHGIEINEYAYELAQITIWIGYIQWLRENGFGFPPEPILQPLKNIVRMDAILAYDKNGKPMEPEWVEADVAVGNPPFLGGSKLRRELGDEYVENIWTLYDERVDRTADLVCYWFEKARKAMENNQLKRAGLLATQSIRSAVNRNVVERIVKDGNIFLAYSDRQWILDGADVRVSMIGFDTGTEQERMLDGKQVAHINANLTATVDVTTARPLRENENLSFQGSMIGGPFQIPKDKATEWLKLANPNGRNNVEVLRPYVTGQDVLRRITNEWVIDFGATMPLEEAAGYEAPFEYVKKNVLPERSKNPRASRREKWWLHSDPQPAMRDAILNLKRYIATIRVSKHRIFVWLSKTTLCSNKLIVVARADDYFLGMLHSRVHEVWSLANSSRHGVGNDPAYTPTTCFETFPFPFPSGKEPKNDKRVTAIAEAAKELVEQRDRWLNPEGASEVELKKRTLTKLYNERPTWLDLAHKRLDEAVFAAYGWGSNLSDDEILAKLLALNLERAGNE